MYVRYARMNAVEQKVNMSYCIMLLNNLPYRLVGFSGWISV